MIAAVTITCTRCGRSVAEPRTHGADCVPRFWYWWPHDHPYVLAVIALAAGSLAGIAVGWML